MVLTAALAMVTFWNPAPEGWIADYAWAMERAQNEGKFVLANFTGSDWCTYCHKLDKEVFETATFRDWAKKNVILLELDYPHNKMLPSSIETQNSILSDRYQKAVEGYPTVLLLDTQGRVLAKNGYEPNGAAVWVEGMNQGLNYARNAEAKLSKEGGAPSPDVN